MRGSRNWVVSISQEDSDNVIYGPYSERRARQLRDQIERAFARAGRLALGVPGGAAGGDVFAITTYPLYSDNVTQICTDYGIEKGA